jgi:hypothetical protein
MKFGRRVVYRESDVQAWIEARFVEAVGGPARPRHGSGVNHTHGRHQR